MPETTTEPRCAWSGDAGELRKEAAGSVVICGQAKAAMNHQHSMLCPRDHAEELICHVFVESTIQPTGSDGLGAAWAAVERLLPDGYSMGVQTRLSVDFDCIREEREGEFCAWSEQGGGGDFMTVLGPNPTGALSNLAAALVARAEAATHG